MKNLEESPGPLAQCWFPTSGPSTCFPVFTPSHLLCPLAPLGQPSGLPAQLACLSSGKASCLLPVPSGIHLSHQVFTCLRPTLPQPPPVCPRSLTLEAGGEPQHLVLPAWEGGAGLRRGWEEAPWVPGGLEPTAFLGGALRIRTGALRSEEGAGSWPGLLQVGSPQGPPHHLPWVWVWGLIPTLSTPCWRLCPRARPP